MKLQIFIMFFLLSCVGSTYKEELGVDKSIETIDSYRKNLIKMNSELKMKKPNPLSWIDISKVDKQIIEKNLNISLINERNPYVQEIINSLSKDLQKADSYIRKLYPKYTEKIPKPFIGYVDGLPQKLDELYLGCYQTNSVALPKKMELKIANKNINVVKTLGVYFEFETHQNFIKHSVSQNLKTYNSYVFDINSKSDKCNIVKLTDLQKENYYKFINSQKLNCHLIEKSNEYQLSDKCKLSLLSFSLLSESSKINTVAFKQIHNMIFLPSKLIKEKVPLNLLKLYLLNSLSHYYLQHASMNKEKYGFFHDAVTKKEYRELTDRIIKLSQVVDSSVNYFGDKNKKQLIRGELFEMINNFIGKISLSKQACLSDTKTKCTESCSSLRKLRSSEGYSKILRIFFNKRLDLLSSKLKKHYELVEKSFMQCSKKFRITKMNNKLELVNNKINLSYFGKVTNGLRQKLDLNLKNMNNKTLAEIITKWNEKINKYDNELAQGLELVKNLYLNFKNIEIESDKLTYEYLHSENSNYTKNQYSKDILKLGAAYINVLKTSTEKINSHKLYQKLKKCEKQLKSKWLNSNGSQDYIFAADYTNLHDKSWCFRAWNVSLSM